MNSSIDKAANGDTEAYGEVVRREQGRLRAFVAARLGNPDDAEDICQEAFVVAYRRLGSFDRGQDFWPWLAGIARNLILNERRKMKREQARLDILKQSLTEYVEDHPVSGTPFLGELSECMQKITDKMNNFLQLRYFKGLSLKEVADAMGMTDGSARVIHVRIMQNLRDCIGRTVGRKAEQRP